MKIESLFHAQLSDLLDGAKHFGAVLPQLLQGTDWVPLRLTLLQLQDLTRKHEKRLELVSWNLGISPVDRECQALRDLTEEMLTTLESGPMFDDLSLPGCRFQPKPKRARDAALLVLLQRANSYETASLSTLSVWEGLIEYGDICRPLGLSLHESRAMQRSLAHLEAQHAVQLGVVPADFHRAAAPVQSLTAV